ncbi:hypothetical protein Mapa_015128 [Marchantia paleacea]|nr:hypothetical protein Mapa_015128 [Marchantia paleacea]
MTHSQLRGQPGGGSLGRSLPFASTKCLLYNPRQNSSNTIISVSIYFRLQVSQPTEQPTQPLNIRQRISLMVDPKSSTTLWDQLAHLATCGI